MRKKPITAALAAILAAQPAFAAENPFHGLPAVRESGLFAGSSIRLTLGEKRSPKPVAALRLASSQRISIAGQSVTSIGEKGAELRFTGEKRPQLYLAGRSAAQMKKKLGLAEPIDMTAVAIAGGLVVVLVALAVLGTDDGCDNEEICGF